MTSREDYEERENEKRREQNKHRAPGETEFRGYSGDHDGFAANYLNNLKIRAEHEKATIGTVSLATDKALEAVSLLQGDEIPDTTGLMGGSQTVSSPREPRLKK